jgi:hypothetical protein
VQVEQVVHLLPTLVVVEQVDTLLVGLILQLRQLLE